MIRPYEPRNQAQVERCIADLQDAERALEADRVEGATIATRYLRDLLARFETTPGGLLVAEEEGQIAGYVALWLEPEPENYCITLANYAYISDLDVLPAYRGHGLGRALLAAAEGLARQIEASALKINVLARNTTAHRLYQSVGFRDYEITLLMPLAE